MKAWLKNLAVGLSFVLYQSSAVSAADNVERLLAELSNAPGAPNFEDPVRIIVARELKPLADRVTYDDFGSVIAQHGALGPRIMLDAHMDEVGGLVRRVTPNGFLSMQMLGGWLDQALPDQRWIIVGSKGPVEAVTGIRDTHVIPAEERDRVFPRNSIFLDIGARTPQEVEALGIHPGDPVVPDSDFAVLNGRRYVGKAFDDRVGLLVLIETLRKLREDGHPNQVFVAATTQEELGSRGARTAAFVIKPDIAIGIESGVTGDSPGRPPEEAQEILGMGPALIVYDTTAMPNPKLVTFIEKIAQEKSIPIQHDLLVGYGDDTAAIQLTATGVPTINIGVPIRYTHAHNSVMDRSDFDRTVDLVTAVVERLDVTTVGQLKSFAP